MLESGTPVNKTILAAGQLPKRRFEFEPSRRRAKVSPNYSRFVGMMKLLLPLLGLGLVVTLLVWPNEFQKTTGFHLAYVSSDAGGSADLTMLRPRYLGMDSQNRPFVVTADSATQDPVDQRLVSLTRLQADMSMADGQWLTAMADIGNYHQQKQILYLEGAINLFSDQGYEFNAQSAQINLKLGNAVSSHPVNGQGPFGTIRADRLKIEEFGQKIMFFGNVKMRILVHG